MERLVATSMAMAAMLYVLASTFIWCALVLGWSARRKSTGSGLFGPRSQLWDRGIAWTALAFVFFAVSARRVLVQHAMLLDLCLIVGGLAVMTAGLFSVWQITREHFGCRVLAVFATLIALVGLWVGTVTDAFDLLAQDF